MPLLLLSILVQQASFPQLPNVVGWVFQNQTFGICGSDFFYSPDVLLVAQIASKSINGNRYTVHFNKRQMTTNNYGHLVTWQHMVRHTPEPKIHLALLGLPENIFTDNIPSNQSYPNESNTNEQKTFITLQLSDKQVKVKV